MWLPLGTNQGLPWLPLARSLTHLITCMMCCLQAIGLSGCGPECAQEQHHMALDCGVVLHTRQGMAPPHRPTALGLVVDTPTGREQFMWQPGYGLWLVPKGQPRVCMCVSICCCASSGWAAARCGASLGNGCYEGACNDLRAGRSDWLAVAHKTEPHINMHCVKMGGLHSIVAKPVAITCWWPVISKGAHPGGVRWRGSARSALQGQLWRGGWGLPGHLGCHCDSRCPGCGAAKQSGEHLGFATCLALATLAARDAGPQPPWQAMATGSCGSDFKPP